MDSWATKMDAIWARFDTGIANLNQRLVELRIAQAHLDTTMAELAVSQARIDRRVKALKHMVKAKRNRKGST
jgi:hypothetical protein